MRYIAIIKSCYPSLSKTEKKVADYILKERGKIIYQTLLEISQNIEVGEATIIRFVRKIGFSGFQDLKLEIAKENNNDIESNSNSLDNNYDSYIDENAERIAQTIINTKSTLDKDNLKLAIKMITDSKRVFFYGVGSSGFTANEAQTRFMRLGVIGNAIIDPHFQSMYSSISNSQDVIIVFSISGYTKDIIEAVKIAKQENTKIIAITSYILSPIAQLADCVLLTSAKENPLEGGSFTGKISQLYIIDLLCSEYLVQNKKSALLQKQKTAEAVVSKAVD
ncbi:MurR/RpiR family transcriptional regulator [Clostridium butyricum]|uniref:Phosphosugar-binding transcriptional regulator, RpiR family n=1 Tax=Clostridium butyricum E4 str. BoNT E BL5262 TaxID=632245 RepID=C4ILY3_CLOBU|nr:MurR/RpiR family transcriptional regulator [Clostridium butyricum]APF23651.1 SIS domain protein [Clostridium butyricum]EDT74582.1 phosphosugar-binding transcriptional regulator, RpiR family [Clostridium butyricum 5521]EEP52684.1 phosphosugar-binding transcriptional regulator, RpiR family [Clostridium butyricum E4 str. BoNT E BL5262]NFL29953.1 MurR/RpiR family transcriptional regulator [Clostridium butyricum]NFS17440.1 MurR/RpiR family transcriptional regulator [Clostridium butyricum]